MCRHVLQWWVQSSGMPPDGLLFLPRVAGRPPHPPRSTSTPFTRHSLDSANAAAVSASPLTAQQPHQDAGPPPLPASVVYKMSCERFSWPQLEPQVHLLLSICEDASSLSLSGCTRAHQAPVHLAHTGLVSTYELTQHSYSPSMQASLHRAEHAHWHKPPEPAKQASRMVEVHMLSVADCSPISQDAELETAMIC